MPSVSLVLLADQTKQAVEVSVVAHVRSLVAAQAVTTGVDALLVAHSPDPAVARLVAGVEGARSAALDSFHGVGRGWEAAWPLCDSDLVLLSTAAAVPDEACVERLVRVLAADRDLAAALPTSEAPGTVLVRRAALQVLEEQRGRGLSRGKQAVFVVQELQQALTSRGLQVQVVRDAGVGGLPLRQQPTVLRAGWTNAQLDVARPDAVTVGPGTYFTGSRARIVTLSPLESVRIGAYCSIADDVRLVNPHDPRDVVAFDDGPRPPELRLGHRPWTATTLPVGNRWPHLTGFDNPAGLRGAELVIGNDVWIGYGATVLGPVTVGDGAVIGAGAVVTKDVPPYAVVAGNPARVLRRRFDDATCDALQRIAWWDWTEEELVRQGAWFLRPAEELVARFDPAAA